MSNRIITVGLMLFALWPGGGSAVGQDFGQLLAAVEKIETNLKELIEQEAALRDRQISKLKATIAKNAKSAEGTAGNGLSEKQLADLITELTMLRAQVAELENYYEKSGTQFASIEDVQGLISKNNTPVKKPKPRISGPKTTVNGRLYSHGLVDFSENRDNYNEFALSRAYVTLKSKLSSYASVRITSDFKAIDDKYNIILKYAYIDWKPGFSRGHAKLRFGLQATQYIDQMNKLWGRRYLEKTAGDKRKFLTSSDMGISTIVGFGPKSRYGFLSLALLNGASYSSFQELNGSKDFNMVSLVKPFKKLPAFSKSAVMMQFYSGTQNKALDDITFVDSAATPWDTTVTGVGASDWKRNIFSIGGLLAWNSTLDFGFDLNFTTVGKGAGKSAVKKQVLSLFGAFHLKKIAADSPLMKSLNFFARVDSYDPNKGNGNDDETKSIFGIESSPTKGFKVALNYRLTNFKDSARDSDSKLYVNTLFKF